MNEENLKICLGAKIKEYRNKLKLTKDELAEKINRTQRQVSLIELGKSFPNPETLLNIAKVFNCDIKELFDFELLKENKNIKEDLTNLIESLPEDKLKLLYLIAKNI